MPPSLPPLELQRDDEAAIGNERKWMRRIDGDRRHHRKDVIEEALIEPVAVGCGQHLVRDEDDAVLSEFLAQLQPARVLLGHQFLGEPAHLLELLGRASARPGSVRASLPRIWPTRPATRTMKNSSRLLPDIDRKRRRSSSGWLGLRASSSTRMLKYSQDSSRLMKRFGSLSIPAGRRRPAG